MIGGHLVHSDGMQWDQYIHRTVYTSARNHTVFSDSHDRPIRRTELSCAHPTSDRRVKHLRINAQFSFYLNLRENLKELFRRNGEKI